MDELVHPTPSPGSGRRDVARVAGVRELVADVLAGNTAMLRLLRALGLPSRRVSDGDTVTVSLALTSLDLPPDRARRARDHLALAGMPAPS
jgi:hypothetical protein